MTVCEAYEFKFWLKTEINGCAFVVIYASCGLMTIQSYWCKCSRSPKNISGVKVEGLELKCVGMKREKINRKRP